MKLKMRSVASLLLALAMAFTVPVLPEVAYAQTGEEQVAETMAQEEILPENPDAKAAGDVALEEDSDSSLKLQEEAAGNTEAADKAEESAAPADTAGDKAAVEEEDSTSEAEKSDAGEEEAVQKDNQTDSNTAKDKEEVVAKPAAPEDEGSDDGVAAVIGELKFASLQAAVNGAKDGDVIVMAGDVQEYVTVGAKNITIDFDGHTLKAKGSSCKKALRVEGGGDVTLKNGTITGGKNLYADPAPIYNYYSKLTMENMTVTGNTGRVLKNDNGTLTITDSLFTKNSINYSIGGVVPLLDSQGTNAKAYITDTRFADNHRTFGYIIAIGGYSTSNRNEMHLTGCDIEDNITGYSTVCMSYNPKLYMTDTTIKNNTSSGDTGGLQISSGAIYMTDSAIYKNITTSPHSYANDIDLSTSISGGQIPLPADMKDHGTPLTGYTMANNRYNFPITQPVVNSLLSKYEYREISLAPPSDLGELAEYDGTVYDSLEQAVAAMDKKPGTVKILKDAAIAESIVGFDGLVIDLGGHTLTPQEAERSILMVEEGRVTIQNGTFSGGTATVGSALRISDVDVTLKDLVVKDSGNSAVRVEHSGYTTGIDPDPKTALIENCQFLGNGQKNGRALHISWTDATIKGCTFDGNLRGLFYINNRSGDQGTTITIEDSSFTNHTEMAAEIYININSKSYLKNTSFENNSTKSDNSVLCMETKSYGEPEMGGDHFLTNCVFRGNKAKDVTIAGETGNITFENCLIENNKAARAGAMEIDPFGKLHLKNTVIKNNEATGSNRTSAGGVVLRAATFTIITPSVNGSQGSSYEYGFFASSFDMEGGALYNNKNAATSPAAEDLYVAKDCQVTLPPVAEMVDGDKDFTGLFWRDDNKSEVEGTPKEKEGSIRYYAIGKAPRIKQIYVDGVNGDDSNPGTKSEPVKSFQKTKELMEENNCSEALVLNTLSADAPKEEAVAESAEEGQENDTIVSGGEPTGSVWDLDGKTLRRAPGFKGYLISVGEGEELILKNITVDGGSKSNTAAEKSIILVSKGGKLTMEKGSAVQNNGYHGNFSAIREGGAILVDGGEMTLNDGLVGGCYGVSGGGIYVKNGGHLLMTGGKIDDNTALFFWNYDLKGHDYGYSYGGGVLLAFGGTMKMTGGEITNNEALHAGGGVSLGTYHSDSVMTGGKSTFTMSGGTIDSNKAYGAGGGLYVQCSTEATITAGNITNNIAQGNLSPLSTAKNVSAAHHAGGGIYVNGYHNEFLVNRGLTHGKLNMTNAEIANNVAAWEGGAIAWCGSGYGNISDVNGAVIYDNRSEGRAPKKNAATPYYGDYEILLDNLLWTWTDDDGSGSSAWSVDILDTLLHETYLSEYMLDGTSYHWMDEEGDEIPTEILHHNLEGRRINTDATAGDPGVQESVKRATVHITGNTSSSNGGGIGCNGDMYIGRLPSFVDIPVEKTWDDAGMEDKRVDSIKVDLLRDGKVVKSMIIKPDAEGKWKGVFREQPEFRVDSNGDLTDEKYVYTVQEDMQYKPRGGKTLADYYECKVENKDGVWVVTNSLPRETLPVTPPLEVKKTLDGKAPEGRAFTFELYDDKGQLVESAQNNDGGLVRFTSLSFDKAGEYTYTIREKVEADADILYDETVFTAVITVVEKDKELVSSVAYSNAGTLLAEGEVPTFYNETIPPKTPKEDEPEEPGKVIEEEPPVEDETVVEETPVEEDIIPKIEDEDNVVMEIYEKPEIKKVPKKDRATKTGQEENMTLILLLAGAAMATMVITRRKGKANR